MMIDAVKLPKIESVPSEQDLLQMGMRTGGVEPSATCEGSSINVEVITTIVNCGDTEQALIERKSDNDVDMLTVRRKNSAAVLRTDSSTMQTTDIGLANPSELSSRGQTFMVIIGKKLYRYWKVSKNWLIHLRNRLAKPFDMSTIQLLGNA